MSRSRAVAAVSQLLLLVLLVLLALPTPPLEGANITWGLTPTSSGDWSIPSNWLGGVVPTTSDTASLTNGGTASIAQAGAVCSILVLDPGTVTLSGMGDLWADFEYVGYSGSGVFTQSGGGNSNSGCDLNLGYYSGSSGTYNLSGNGQLSAFSEHVGASGNGVFNQSGGANAIYYGYGDLYLGEGGISRGTYNLSGDGQLSAYWEHVGVSGSGVFTQSGGTNDYTDLYLGEDGSGSGTYNLSGSGLLSGLSEHVGLSGSGVFTQSGGTNLVLSDGLYLGHNPGSRGAYNLGGSGLLSSNYDEYVGYSGSGTFTQSGGTNSASVVNLANDASANGTYNLNGGLLSTGSLAKGAGTAAFNLGGGTLQATGGFTTTVPVTFNAGNSVIDTNDFGIIMSGVALNGASSVRVLSGTNGTGWLTLGAITRHAGSTVDFVLPASGGVSTTSGTANSILTDSSGVPYGTVGGSEWAAKDSSNTNIVSGSTISSFYTPSTSASLAGNADVASGIDTTLASSTSISTLRMNWNEARWINLGNNTLTTGGILVTNNVTTGSFSLSGGTLEGAGNELVIIQNGSQPFTIDSTIADNASPTGLTKAGLGTLALMGSNTYTGDTIVDAGVLKALALSSSDSTITVGGGVSLTATLAVNYIRAHKLVLNPGSVVILGGVSAAAAAVDPGGNVASSYAVGSADAGAAAVPEPSTVALLGAGAIAMLAYVYRRRKRIS